MLDEQYRTGNRKTDALIENALRKDLDSKIALNKVFNNLLDKQNKKGKFTVAVKEDRTSIDNTVFDSKQEKVRYEELVLLQKAGEISDLEIQKRFVLLDTFRYKGETILGVSYYADFYYIEKRFQSDLEVIEEWKVKATRTKDYIIKSKFMKHRYPQIDFREMVSDA